MRPVIKVVKSSVKRIPQMVHHPRVILPKTHRPQSFAIDTHQVSLHRHRSPFLSPLKNIPEEE